MSGADGGNVDLSRTAGVIRRQQPDIVALQEVDRFWARSGSEDQPARLAELLGMNVCFAANVELAPDHPHPRAREYGVAVLSRWPMTDHRIVPLPVAAGWEPRGMLVARVDLGSREIVVINTHLQVDQPGHEGEGRWQRTVQAGEVVRAARDAALPTVVVGDFNARPDDPELAALVAFRSGLLDVWRVAGAGTGATIPANLHEAPRDRIDYIFASRDFRIGGVRVVDGPVARQASDHLPVVADLILGDGDCGGA